MSAAPSPETADAKAEFERARWMTGAKVPDGWDFAATMETKRDELAGLLERSRQFMCHDDDCKAGACILSDPSEWKECTCGYSDLIARIQAALGG